ncbi:radical SAM protein [bacterium]|nr:radical SAM protein [bacterium]
MNRKLLLADKNGAIYEHPELQAASFNGRNWVAFSADNIPLPEGSKLFTLPGRLPVGFNSNIGQFEIVHSFEDESGGVFQPLAVSSFLPPAYMRLHLPAYVKETEAPILPQWAYTAIAGSDEHILAAAVRVDYSERWNPDNFDDSGLPERIDYMLDKYPENRLLEHIAHCAAVYHCFAAKNLFMKRWEAPLPIAKKCNAACLGCLSLQTGDIPSSHNRIDFIPSPEEIAQIALEHIASADDPLLSFGQGCEGEPLTEWKLIRDAIKIIRRSTDDGTIHLNTNGSIPEAVPYLADAGLNSVRVSLNSAVEANYNSYFKPVDYRLKDVIEFIKLAKKHGLFVHINLLIFPGVTDIPQEMAAFKALNQETNVDLIQLKNLNIDPDYYLEAMRTSGEPIGLQNYWFNLKADFPKLRFGYFNIQKERFAQV